MIIGIIDVIELLVDIEMNGVLNDVKLVIVCGLIEKWGWGFVIMLFLVLKYIDLF